MADNAAVKELETVHDAQPGVPAAPFPIENTASPPAPADRGLIQRFEDKVKQLRGHAIAAMPNFVVNNSSNILGASHVATEIAMFKASMAKNKDFALVRDKSNPLNYVKDPIVQTWKGTVENARTYTSLNEIFRGDPTKGVMKNVVRYVTDTDAANLREKTRRSSAVAAIEKAAAEGVAAPRWAKNPAIYGNRWQTRSTLAGLVVWTLSTLIPDKKENPDEVERMAELEQTSAVRYSVERLRQAVWVPEWREHKRQMIGLGVMVSGVCSFLGSWRVRQEVAKGIVEYGKRDNSYLMTSLFTLASGTALTFSLDDERGFSRFGMGMMGRLLFLPKSIFNRYAKGDPGKHWYAGASASFQLENMAQSLIGGAEKNEDGTVIDHASIRKDAKLKAKIKVAARKTGEPITDEEVEARVKRISETNGKETADTPSNSVSHVSAERAVLGPTMNHAAITA